MKERIIALLKKPTKLSEKELSNLIEIPKDSAMGDYAFPCFILAAKLKKNPIEIAKELENKLENSLEIEKVEASGPYLNFFVNRSILIEEILNKIQIGGSKYGSSNLGKGKKILLEFSSPNIAKPFGIGHLRSTIIGNSIANISEFSGFNVTRMNYLGDWGTQFGKLILGYKKFGSPEKLKKDPLKHLLEVYVKINKNEKFEDEARAWFKKLEGGDKDARKIWVDFSKLSRKEFEKIYSLLGIKFKVWDGESKYNQKMQEVLKKLEEKGLLKESEGALIVDLKVQGLGVVIIKKSDGTTIYATRDIAAAIERKKKYKFDQMFYEVGSEQTLHFRQIFRLIELLGHSWAKDCRHIAHGLYLGKDGKRLATRKGKNFLIEDLISEAKELARNEILKREPKVKKNSLDERAFAIAKAAIFYGDLKSSRINDIVFDLEKLTSFEGDTGPYLLYTYARARNILKKAKYSSHKKFKLPSVDDIEKNIVSQLSNFENVVKESYNSLSPNLIANYAYQLSQTFNEFYHSNQVIGSEKEQFRLVLVDSFSQVLKNALNLLGIKTIERM